MADALPFLLGHGTANDFVLLPDHDAGRYGPTLDPALVVALCDRRRGIGADGVIRVVRTDALPDVVDDEVAGTDWFMDYRNADGSLAEMCGNGIRVLALHLARAGLAADPRRMPIGTRGGVVTVAHEDDGTLSVDMGAPAERLSGQPVHVRAGDVDAPGTAVAIPNPHAVVAVTDLAAPGTLTVPPHVTPPALYPEGTNVEFVRRAGPQHLQMRVWERGVGETMSCGTGVCAAAWVGMREDGAPSGTPYVVDVPGGRLTVVARDDGRLVLRGPAVLVAEGSVDRDALPA